MMSVNRFVISLLLILTTQITTVFAQSVVNVSAQEFKELIERADGVVLDVRTPQETSRGHIKEASFINFYDENFTDKIRLIQKNKLVYVYCKSGGRSSSAAQMLAKEGQVKVYNLLGGFSAWEKANYPSQKQETHKDENIQSLSVLDFQKLVSEKKTVLVDFHTQWCVPCKKMIPILDDLEQVYQDKIHILRVDVDDSKALADFYKVEAVPTLIFIQSEEIIWRNAGFITKEDLMKKIEVHSVEND